MKVKITNGDKKYRTGLVYDLPPKIAEKLLEQERATKVKEPVKKGYKGD